MNIPVLFDWIKALKSGNYKQIRGCLRDDGYCALGVLGCVLEKYGEKINFDGTSFLHPDLIKKYIPELDKKLQEEFSRHCYSPSDCVIKMNDYLKMNFEEIGDVLLGVLRKEVLEKHKDISNLTFNEICDFFKKEYNL